MMVVPYHLELVTAPAGRVVETSSLREHLRFNDTADEEQVIADILSAAELYVQETSGKQLLTATYDLKLREFCENRVIWPRPPLISVTYVKYYDLDGTLQTWSTDYYDVVAGTEHAAGYVKPKYNQDWPVTRGDDLDIIIRGVCGFGSKSAVPETFKQQIRLLGYHWFMNRAAVSCGEMSRADLAYDALSTFNMRQEFF